MVRFSGGDSEIFVARVFSPLTGTSVRFIGAYCLPSYKSAENERLMNALATLLAADEPTILCGDFNYGGIEWCDNKPSPWPCQADGLVQLAISASLEQHVVSGTRANSVLDLVFSNNTDLAVTSTVIPGIGRSDHNCVEFSVSFHCDDSKPAAKPFPLLKESALLPSTSDSPQLIGVCSSKERTRP